MHVFVVGKIGIRSNSEFTGAKLVYYFNELKNLKKQHQLEHKTFIDDREGEDRCEQRSEGLDEGEGNSG
jgi:hypothetical protein